MDHVAGGCGDSDGTAMSLLILRSKFILSSEHLAQPSVLLLPVPGMPHPDCDARICMDGLDHADFHLIHDIPLRRHQQLVA